jgi:hypothetical protein
MLQESFRPRAADARTELLPATAPPRSARRLLATAVLGVVTLAVVGCGRESGRDLVVRRASVQPVGNAPLLACLQRRGWNAHSANDGSIEFIGPVTDGAAYGSALALCQEKYEARALPFGEWSDEDWRKLYAQELVTRACLARHGVKIPSPPGYRLYKARYQSPRPWTSYQLVRTASQDEWNALNRSCPQPSYSPVEPPLR